MRFPNQLNPVIWLVGTSFVLLQFFLQLSSGLIIDVIMHDMHLTALAGGLLSGSFYVIYTLLQIPVGMLCDRKNIRPILTSSALICAVGCIVFATGHHLWSLYLGRSLLAIGSAFGFVCLTHLVRQHYPLRYFGLLIGASETLSFMVTVVGMMSLASMLNHWSWRQFIAGIAILACGIAYLCWRFIPNTTPNTTYTLSYRTQLKQVLSSLPLWFNGLFTGLTFAIVLVFAGLWAPPFLQIKLHCTLREASILDAVFIFGISVSCPLFGYLANHIRNHRVLVISACLLTSMILLCLLWMPPQSITVMAFIMWLLGFVSGSYILGYTFANQFSPPHSLSTTTGMTNTLAIATTPLLQPFIGYLLDTFSHQHRLMVWDYQEALMILPLCILIAAGLVALLPLTHKP